MSVENREQILADFQACTGIDDVAHSIFLLEETSWDLLRAVSRVMPPGSQSFRSNFNADPEVMVVDDFANIAPTPLVQSATTVSNNGAVTDRLLEDNSPNSATPSTSAAATPTAEAASKSKTKSDKLKFHVQYEDRMICLELPQTATISDLKIQLHRELNITPCRQLLSGWARMSQYENVKFSELQIPNENVLHLTVKHSELSLASDNGASSSNRFTREYVLNIQTDRKTYKLKYPGTSTIQKVKEDIFSLIDVPVRNQEWTGWPPNIDNDTVLAVSGIRYPEHDLSVRKTTSCTSNNQKERKLSIVVNIDSDDEEFEDASEGFNVVDEYFVDNVTSKRSQPLIPEDIDDEVVASISFSEQFTARYGPVHPAFFQGTLEDAIKEACLKPATTKKILAIYLHHDASVLTNVFCTQLLGYESVMQLFETSFVLWGWDLTFEINQTRLQTSVANTLGSTAAVSLRTIPLDRLPALILIMRIRSSTEIFSVIHGNVGVNELLSGLIEAVEVFSDHQRVEIVEEKERAERELVKWEQDEAYRESLEADRAKEEAKQAQAKAELEAKTKRENEEAEQYARKEAHRRAVEANLPAEPSEGLITNGSAHSTVTKIRCRLPNGENIERRFLSTAPLSTLLDFLTVKGYPGDEYKVISSWPRRDLTLIDGTQTLEQLKLCPQETVILEER